MRRSLILLATLGWSCAAPAQQPAPAPPPAGGDPALEARYAWLSGLHPDRESFEQRVAALPFDSVELERTACFGTCPIYRVVFRRDGTATWRGERFVERVGEWRAEVGPYAYGRLSYAIERLGIMRLDSAYRARVTDLPSTILRVWRTGGRTPKQVLDYGNLAPPDFWVAVHVADGLAGGARWTRAGAPP